LGIAALLLKQKKQLQINFNITDNSLAFFVEKC